MVCVTGAFLHAWRFGPTEVGGGGLGRGGACQAALTLVSNNRSDGNLNKAPRKTAEVENFSPDIFHRECEAHEYEQLASSKVAGMCAEWQI